MNLTGYEKARLFRLKEFGWSEDYVQKLIAEDPSILGLGALDVKGREIFQVSGGRLDFILQDSPGTTRYEVEIQLGETNPSHIIRTIEYWDRERWNAQQLEHIAVIVAEDITSRFFNVISLFNQHIPLIAIKMSGIEIGEKRSIVFTRVLDLTKKVSQDEDEDAGLPEANRAYWEKKSSIPSMILVDEIINIAKKINPSIGPRFNKGAIPLKIGGLFRRFFTIYPKGKSVKMSLPVPQLDTIEAKLTDADIDFEYQPTRGRYLLTITQENLPKQSATLESLILIAYKNAENDDAEAAEL